MQKNDIKYGSYYCKLPDGTLIQWGKYLNYKASDGFVINFSIPFVDSSYSIAYSIYWYTTNYHLIFWNEKPESIEVIGKYNDPSENALPPEATIGGVWTAIGRWKK